MRHTLLAPAIVLGIATAGLHCASADASPGHPSTPQSVLEHRRPAFPAPGVDVVDESMQGLPTFAHDDRRYVLGETGQRYLIRLTNPTGSRVEAVVSVDGLDAIDGRPANLSKRGYVVPAYGDVTIDGWRTSLDAVAAFRFSSVRDSYAARTGHDRNVGVIGVAFYRERPRPAVTWRPPPPLKPAGRAEPAPSAPPADASQGAGAPGETKAAPQSRSAAAERERPGLGTQFGEAQESHVSETTFVRADSSPTTVVELRYDDRDGLVSRGIAIPPWPPSRDAENELRDTAQPFPGSRFAQPPP